MQPPASLKVLNEPIYEVFYGLTEQPFAISTDPKFLFMSASHQNAFEELVAGLERRESVLVVTGETGSGKTTLCRGVIEALGDRTVSSIQHHPYLVGADMLRLVVRDFGLVSHEELRRGAFSQVDVPQLIDVLERFLRTLVPLDSRAILVLDEAQSLAPKLLDEIRMLTAFEHNGQRLVQIILCGQPALLKTLGTEPLYALNERVSRRVVLRPLSPDEVAAYIEHRITIAGGASSVSFSSEAVDMIAQLSRGLPRRVNLLCDRALQEGRVESASVIRPELIKRAAKALAGAPEERVRPAPVPAPEPGPESRVQAPESEVDRQEIEVIAEPPSTEASAVPSAFGTLFRSDAPADAIAFDSPFASEVPAAVPKKRPLSWANPNLRWAAAAALVVTASAAAYGFYARSVLAGGPVMLAPPVAPRSLPPPAEPVVPPTIEELNLLMLMSVARVGTG